MLDYALSFYNNYTIIFYLILTISVIIEGPIVILTLSILAPKLGFSFLGVFIFAIVGEYFGDILHYIIGRFLKKKFFHNKSYKLLIKMEEKLKNHSLLDKIIVIKYTPPITSIGLLYFGFQKENFIKFSKIIFTLSVINGIIITFIGFNFGMYLKNENNLGYIVLSIMLAFLVLFFIVKLISKFLLKKVFKK